MRVAVPEPVTPLAPGPIRYQRHRPETTLLYQVVERHYPDFLAELGQRDRHLPTYVQEEFEAYLKCGRLEHGFLRVRCTTCHAERLVAFSCKRRGFCPSCGARRMTGSAALLVDEVLPAEPLRQWVLSVPFPLRFLFAAEPAAMGEVLGIVWRAIEGHLIRKRGDADPALRQRAEPEHPLPHAVPATWSAAGCWCGTPSRAT